ncbi:MAG TPA: ABC transporter permease [Gemmatimonadaceae bacterium]|jgi:predicted permease
MRYRLRIDRLAELLAASRLSQNHWAIRLGLSRGHWSDIVNGRHPFPSAKTRQRMIEVFGVPAEQLFVGDTGASDQIDFKRAIAHRYELLSELGQGAMGAVHLATDRALGRLVALKVVSPEAAAGVGPDALLKEITFVARLQHPNILPLFDAGEAAGHPYYVMPYVRDGSLRALLDRAGRLELRDALPLITGIANGLSHAHERQILHCDVKPENILVQDHHSFVMDFGIARKLRSEAREWAAVRTELDFSAGTPAYVSPEQASGERDVDQRSDVYSLACVVFEMLSGRAPFGGRDTQEIVSRRFHEPPPALDEIARAVPRSTALVLTRALSLDAALRPESAREFAEDLNRSVIVAVPVTATMPAPPAVTSQPRRKPAPSSVSMQQFLSDIRVALRGLRKHWRFSVGVILTLGLGVGLGVPALSLADSLFLRAPSGVRDPDRVFRLVERGVSQDGPYFTDGLTGLDYTTLTSRANTLDGVAGWIILSRSLGRGADARPITAGVASASFFNVLGARLRLGRFYNASEDVEGAPPACVVSYAFWKNSLGGTDDALGKRLTIGDHTYTVVGVASDGFNGLELRTVDVWLPLHVASPEFNGRDDQLWTTDHSSWLRMAARLKPGISLDAATAEAGVLYSTAGARTRDKELKGTFVWDPLQPGRSSLSPRSAKIALWLSAGAALLLLLVSANLINLFVAREAVRVRQTAIRLAIGGGWRDIMRLQIVESILLAAIAAFLGLVVAAPAVGIARSLLMPGLSWSSSTFDLRVAAIAFGVATVIGVVIALWTTIQAARVHPSTLLRGAGSTQSSDARRAHALRRALLVVQAAVFAVLLTSAAAFVNSLRRASTVDFGFDPSRILSAPFAFPAETPRSEVRALLERGLQRVAALPGVESASLGYMEPWSNNTGMPISVPGSHLKAPYSLLDIVSPEYPKTFGIAMRTGRWISSSDAAGTAPVVVLNETLAKALWPSGDAVGHCLRVGDDTMPCREIVGVVQDFRVTGNLDDKPMPVEYLAYAQTAGFRQWPKIFVRPRGDATSSIATIRQALQALDPRLPAIPIHSLTDNTTSFIATFKLGATAFMTFGVVAAIVAAIGLYSVLSFLVVEQRRSHAIRLAIGASPSSIAQSVVRYGMTTAGVGMIVGWLILIPLRQLIEPLLFHTTLLNATTVALVAIFGGALTFLAALTPARAVARTDIINVLREQ